MVLELRAGNSWARILLGRNGFLEEVSVGAKGGVR